MFTKSAELYDAIYSFKDYAAEAAQLAALVRAVNPGARTLLDVAAGHSDRVRRALDCFRRHLSPGGVVVVEPWFGPGDLESGRVMRQVADTAGSRVERIGRTEVDGRISRLHFEYVIEGPEVTRHETEVHELGLFTVDEMRDQFRAAGLSADLDPVGLTGRGLWVARAG